MMDGLESEIWDTAKWRKILQNVSIQFCRVVVEDLEQIISFLCLNVFTSQQGGAVTFINKKLSLSERLEQRKDAMYLIKEKSSVRNKGSTILSLPNLKVVVWKNTINLNYESGSKQYFTKSIFYFKAWYFRQ